MGVLTDFVVAKPEDAPRIGASLCPSRDFGGMDSKGIDTVKLGKLYANLTGRSFEPRFMASALRFQRSEDGPWVFEVPGELVLLLAALSPEKVPAVAREWVKAKEFGPPYGNWSVTAVEAVLAELAKLCRQAAAEGKVLFMWICL